MPTYNKADMLNCAAGHHDFSEGADECHVCGHKEADASAPVTVGGYAIERTANGRFYLMQGQATPGHNNGVPIASLAEAWRIAEAWKASGVRPPYPSA